MILKEPGALSGPQGAICPSVKVREMIPLDNGNKFPKFLRNGGFHLTARNLPIVQVELIGLPWSLENWSFFQT